ncbi:hypothetical protein B0H16DRAFT_1274673, partial [Mycena metata]
NGTAIESEIPAILDIISAGQHRLDALDPQIHTLQTTLAQLVRGRADTVGFFRQHRAIIFASTCTPGAALRHLSLVGPRFGRGQPPWHLGHICRSWRHIARSFPALW